jgi:hypothetical protein
MGERLQLHNAFDVDDDRAMYAKKAESGRDSAPTQSTKLGREIRSPQGSMWLNVLSDDAYAQAKAKSPDAVKVRVGSVTDFAKVVSASKASFNPAHTHVQVNSDGTIASVYFDFVFLIDGKEQNRGSETWVLVKGGNGWRIAAITYSSNPPA